jgi:hypothetical protein
MLDNIVKLIAVFPGWATLLIFVCFSILVALLAILARARAAKKLLRSSQNDILEKSRTFMKLKQIQLFPDDPSAEVNVIVYVNGVAFHHPSETEIKWMPVIANMNEKIIELPRAEMYYIRFEINFSSEKKLEGGPALVRGGLAKKDGKKTTDQTLATYPAIPLVADYKLYLLQDGSRDTSVKATISYEIYVEEIS